MNSAMSSASSATRESVAEDSSDYQLDAPRVAPTEINPRNQVESPLPEEPCPLNQEGESTARSDTSIRGRDKPTESIAR